MTRYPYMKSLSARHKKYLRLSVVNTKSHNEAARVAGFSRVTGWRLRTSPAGRWYLLQQCRDWSMALAEEIARDEMRKEAANMP